MLPATTISPSNSCFSFATSWMTSRKHRRVVPVGILQRGGHDVLGHLVQPVRQFAAPGWPPRGEELVGSPTEQLGLGAKRLVEQELRRLELMTGAKHQKGKRIGVFATKEQHQLDKELAAQAEL